MNNFFKDDILKIECNEITYEGYGAARFEKYSIFVPNFLPGEIAKIKLNQVYSKYAFGEVVEFIKKSGFRLKDKQYLQYNNASLVNLEYKKQIEFKSEYFHKLIKWNLGIEDKLIYDFINSPVTKNYRNKARFPFLITSDNIDIGQYQRRSNKIIKLDQDLILVDKKLELKIKQIITLIKKYYSNNENKSFFKELTVRIGENNKLQIIIEITNFFNLDSNLIEELKNTNNINQLFLKLENKYIKLINISPLNMRINDKQFLVNPTNFFQVNSFVSSLMFNKIKEINLNSNKKILIDLFCGVGVISQLIATNNQRIIGVDIDRNSIDLANQNKEINKVNGTYYSGDAFKIIESKAKKINLEDSLVVVDPPRSGLNESIIQWFEIKKIKEIIYMSCDPKSLIRDLKLFQKLNYKINYIQGFDMFPNTEHIESITYLKKD
ncbi:23S rRNA (uracil(1939)-C(5))-methyltransferase RlmD [Mycoplasma sp. CSL10137]|uniref:23S rRNA (uracil(1939)-C(5))-methyltransferase RlmD n=1 Tax=Mycoplasma sp. CSL10137 TaxID=2813824 RepID=UPI00197C3103|nr:23S rRNA (uracil(1939)-C(5))-methyltransferase RlmD [Mycoplasma sp. CSL10137]MBN4083358.1 23S rRNA (uracil(1939)-C(5))-methyltransferase RlmD [Mycoplasma sp. CSL10137]